MARISFWMIVAWMMAALSPAYSQENVPQLIQEGNAAFGAGDYISATYYFERILQSPDWAKFPNQEDILMKLAMIEESQARFEEAARYYRQIVDRMQDNSPQERAMRRYYLQRYADTLERAGGYEQAGRIFWQLTQDASPEERPLFLKRVIKNYGFQKISVQQIDVLKTAVIPQYEKECGWTLAGLLQIQGRDTDFIELCEHLWPLAPDGARDYASQIVQVYSSSEKLEDLLARMRREVFARDNDSSLLMLAVSLLEENDQGLDALTLIEQYMKEKLNINPAGEAEVILSMLPAPVLNKWIDLIVRIRGAEQGIERLRGIVKQLPLDLTRRKSLSSLLMRAGNKDAAIQLWADWAKSNLGMPMAILSAAQEIFAIGDADAAKSLLDQLRDRIPPPLALNQGGLALQFGDFEGAIAAFQTAIDTGGVNPAQVTQTVLQVAETDAQPDHLIAFLIQSASGHSFQEIPEWIRTPLLHLGINPPYRSQLQSLAKTDSTGVWNYSIAIQALETGEREWALSLLQDIPDSSVYAPIAKLKRADILGSDSSIVAQKQAADLIFPEVQAILSGSSTVSLNPLLANRLVQYAEYRLDAYQPDEALLAVRVVESASATLETPLTEEETIRLQYDHACAWVELGSFGPAVRLLESIDALSYKEDALFLLARIHIAKRELEEAQTLLHQLTENSAYWRRANDALALLNALEPLVGDAQELFCDSMLYQLQGRFSAAIPPLRQIAVDYYGSDVEEWARSTIGELKENMGDSKAAQEEWERLLMDVDNPVLQGITRLNLMHLSMPASSSIAEMTPYQELLIDLPNTIFSDLARLDMQRALGKEQPE